MQHVQTARKISERADLEQRLTGRYYTPLIIANHLAKHVIDICPRPTSIGDPFCGDGRLIVAWLQYASTTSALEGLRRIVLWDYDAYAVSVARQRVEAEIAKLGLSAIVSVIAEPGDTFARAHTSRESVDTVLTNPPWELLKPDARDGLPGESAYKGQLRDYASILAQDFPGAVSANGKAMSGYGVNLARAGAIASTMLTNAGGGLAIVLPSSIFADQASLPFRSEFFTRINVARIDLYPAEARLFNGVDQPFVTAIGVAGSKTSTYLLSRFDKHLSSVDQRPVTISGDASRPVALNVGGEHENLVAELAKKHAPLDFLEVDMRYGLWLGRELDETRLGEFFTDKRVGVPFLKGRHVFPFEVLREEVCYIDPMKRKIPNTVRETRLAWRDVSRPNQRRRMHVALVPQGNVTGNSLGVAFFRYGPLEHIHVLMAVMNSMVFELQIRAHLATAHVSQGVLRKCSVPMSCFEDRSVRDHILSLVARRLEQKSESPELETTIARAYGLDRAAFLTAMDAFPKLTVTERSAYLRDELWS